MVFASTDKNIKVLEKYKELWDEMKSQTETINSGEPIKYKKDFMKIRFGSDDNLPLDISSMIIVTRFVFQKVNKHYRQVYLNECVYKFLNEL